MSLFYSSLDKKMKSQRKENDSFQEATDKQVQAQKNLILTNRLKAMNEDIIARIVQRVDENKEDARQTEEEEKIAFKNITNESVHPALPFDNNIVTKEGIMKILYNPDDFLKAVEKVAAIMRVKGKFTDRRKKFNATEFITKMNANGIKQGTVNNLIFQGDFELAAPESPESPPASPAASPSVSPKGSPKAKGKKAKRT